MMSFPEFRCSHHSVGGLNLRWEDRFLIFLYLNGKFKKFVSSAFRFVYKFRDVQDYKEKKGNNKFQKCDRRVNCELWCLHPFLAVWQVNKTKITNRMIVGAEIEDLNLFPIYCEMLLPD